MSTTTLEDRFHLNNAQFHWGLAEEMLAFRDESAVNFFHKAQLSNHMESLIIHSPQILPPKVKNICCVCQLEIQFWKAANVGTKEKAHFSMKYVVGCTKENYAIHCLNVHIKSSNSYLKWHKFRV